MASGGAANEKYVCNLPPDLMKKAEEELNEKPEWRDRDIQALRDMVLKNAALKCPTDDAFLLRFLRARKFDYERAYNLLVNYYKIRAENPSTFKDFKPATIKHVLESNVTTVLPKRNKEGQALLFFRPGLWDPDLFPIFDILRTNIMLLEKLIQEEDVQINGIVMIGDMKDMGLKQARAFDRNYARLMSSVLQESFPLRFKGLHVVHEPSIFSYIFAIVRPFLKEKTAKRMNFHGWNESSLHERVPKEFLPEEVGGDLGPVNTKIWIDKMLSCDAEFEAMQKYGINLPGVQTYSGADAMECLTGTYKKLSVD